MDCWVCKPAGDVLVRVASSVGKIGGGFSHESEHDLAVMVSDFLENGSAGADSWCSSDSDSGFCDLSHLAEEILSYKHLVDQYGCDLLSVVHSLLLSINEKDIQFDKENSCKASCIRLSLVKLLRSSGYDAALCVSRWQTLDKIPGGYHEYIDVINHKSNGNSERIIIDIDFRSHFEIARAVKSYDQILSSLPVVYVGSLPKLKRFLKVMAEAARTSLNQNSMTLPPWRSLDYLNAKWGSGYKRHLSPDKDGDLISSVSLNHNQCIEHLKILKSLIRSEIEIHQFFIPVKKEKYRRFSSFRNL